MIGTQIARAEYHKQRADRVTKIGKEIDALNQKYLKLVARMEHQLASTTKEFSGRDKRKARAEIYSGILMMLREILATAPPEISWPVEDCTNTPGSNG